MSEPELNETQPDKVMDETQPNSPAPVAKKNFPRWLVALFVLALIVIGFLGGYGSGMNQRYAAQDTVVTGQLAEQFQLGKQAMEAGNYEMAKQYFDGILNSDSSFPGIQAVYTDLMLRMQVTPTPVFSPTPLVSPTPDLRAADEIYNTALQYINTRDWNAALTNLDSLRKQFPEYRTAVVDGMYYTALRQRGVDRIAVACQDANLQGGINDITLAEHFVGTGNLDSYAESLRTYARLYIIASSFWDQDWRQAQDFFSQVMAGYPNMSDSSCKSATKRWYEATIKRAEQYLAAGDFCAAEEQFALAFTVGDPYNEIAFPTATQVTNQCNGDGGGGDNPTPEGTPAIIPTPTP
jgi:tetratricopeptide (TPR) repeat protein